jgi:hypothetical protein
MRMRKDCLPAATVTQRGRFASGYRTQSNRCVVPEHRVALRHTGSAQRLNWSEHPAISRLWTRASLLPRRPLLALALVAVLFAACDTNPFDPSQQPRVTVVQDSGGSAVTIHWERDGAQLVRVYRGSTAGDGYGDDLMWSIAAETVNGLSSGVTYGSSPTASTTDFAAKPLLPGETYTAEVTRRDPRGSGEGFTNTRNRYVGTATFTLEPPSEPAR